MARFRLTMKGIVLLTLFMSFISFGLGFGVWKLTGYPNLAPTDSSAGGNPPNPPGGGGTGNTTSCVCAPQANNPDAPICGGRYDSKECNDYWAKQNKETQPPQRKCICAGVGSNNCGVNCKFAEGTEEMCQELSDINCNTYIAMCDSRGRITCQVFNEKHRCWGHEDECKNPVTYGSCEENTCDTGGIISPANSASYNVGEVVNVKGWAADKDGINKGEVVVSVNGSVVGNATAHDVNCTTSPSHFACQHGNSAFKSIWWEYNYTVTTTGAITFSVVWEDTLGNGGNSCKASRGIVGNVQGNPDWEISKTGASVCIDETAGSQIARIDYSIVIKNVGDLAGKITSLVDKLDNKVQSSYILNATIDPDATVSGNKITWSLDDTEGSFSPNEQKEFSYSIEVPQAAFGQYTNTATATPETGDAFKAIEVVYASCSAPETGIFDSAIAKVMLGMILIGVSGAYLYSDKNILTLGKFKKKSPKENFEDRVVAGK